jgi:hypothetical protein
VLTRTVGGPRVGSFAGTISKQALAALAKLVEQADDLDARPTGLPPHVLESDETTRADITVGARSNAAGPAAKLVKRMRQLADELTDQPVAALELRVADDGHAITLASVGTEPVDADLGSASITWTLFGQGEELLTAGEIDAAATAGSKQLAVRWSAELPISPEPEFNPRRTLDVQAEFDLVDSKGRSRRARLRAIAGKGWSR